MPRFHLESILAHPRDEVFDWHLRPGALERLTPPWADVRVLHREGGPATRGVVKLQVRRGPVPLNWEVRHTDFEPGALFCDEQISGPFSRWKHEHRFRDAEDGGTSYVDDVDYALPVGAFSNLLAGTSVERELSRLFRFRHQRLHMDLDQHARMGGPPLKVAISGASGFLGSQLRHFLTTGGHQVLRLVRREAAADDEVQWSPDDQQVDLAPLEGVDAVVHLAGKSISSGRWSADRKREIYRSRVNGTKTLALAVSRLRRRPSVFVSASAVGYYGNRGDQPVDESAKAGSGFLADVCEAWESATGPLRGTSCRVVNLRFGLVLSPAGGALGTMILPFKMGVGGRLGTGRQYVSWIDVDDAVGLILHAIRSERLRGAMNVTAPHPVTNATFTSALGRVLGRPTLIPVPSLAVKALFGEMGDALLLKGARVLPKKALESGYTFRFSGLEESLRFQLGQAAK